MEHYLHDLIGEGVAISTPTFIMGGLMTEDKKAKAKPISKKELVRQIIENNDRFDVGSLLRTNASNLKIILDLVS